MRAYEQKKDGIGQRGILWMVIEGDETAVRKVDAILSKEFQSDLVECDDHKYGGKFYVGFYVDRNEKADFMAAYKAAKASIKGE